MIVDFSCPPRVKDLDLQWQPRFQVITADLRFAFRFERDFFSAFARAYARAHRHWHGFRRPSIAGFKFALAGGCFCLRKGGKADSDQGGLPSAVHTNIFQTPKFPQYPQPLLDDNIGLLVRVQG
jgi:hypothetical protein